MSGVVVRGDISARDAVQLLTAPAQCDEERALSIIVFLGSWNRLGSDGCHALVNVLSAAVSLPPLCLSVSSVTVDQDEDSEKICADDCQGEELVPVGMRVPGTLPALAMIAADGVPVYANVDPVTLLRYLRSPRDPDPSLYRIVLEGLEELVQSATINFSFQKRDRDDLSAASRDLSVTTDGGPDGEALRIFVAGDRSHVGKSSVCLGLLGSLLRIGYDPSSLAYIKPATQCEATQLVAEYCKKNEIECIPVGPVVFYKGFTRAFLAGETDPSEKLLEKAGRAVDDVARGKKVVIVDGVGYPAVGSICGIDNASVARACGPLMHGHVTKESMSSEDTSNQDKMVPEKVPRNPASVILVGRAGVGDAVDSFNLNATFFESKGVPVLGAVFNRLSNEGYYSLESCKQAVSSYFNQYRPDQKPFGFIPEVPGIAKSRDEGSSVVSGESDLEKAMRSADAFIDTFASHVDVIRIIKNASKVSKELSHSGVHVKIKSGIMNEFTYLRAPKRPKHGSTQMPMPQNGASRVLLTREQIEEAAKAGGAAGG